MKRVYCLYRVSTKGQVVDDDIPMQKQECHRFADMNGWSILKEFTEMGVSGFKVKAEDRDAVQDLKVAAEKKEFDILLVFMFDRLGRIQNETPFVVEWFIGQGIEVWSAKEGQQCLETDADYLMNYMRFWQANGESKKISTRVKTRMNQLVAEGAYTGGVTPFGYQLVKSGKVNKRGHELKDMVIDEYEAPIVRLIFEKTVKEGCGSHHLAEYLNKMNIRTHNGCSFQSNNINRILKNRLYCGYRVAKDIVSPFIPELKIIDEEIFEEAQKIIASRARTYEKKQRSACITQGKSLLSGNLICGHCGSKMVATGYVNTRKRKDGSIYRMEKVKYICYNRSRGRGECDGQGSYFSDKVDPEIEKIVIEYLKKIKLTPKDVALEVRYKTEIKETKMKRDSLKKSVQALQKQQEQLSDEIAKSLTGDSMFTPQMLSDAIAKNRAQLAEQNEKLIQIEYDLNNQHGAMKKLDFYYEQFQSWADEYVYATWEQKKMIIWQLVSEVHITRGYKMNVLLDVNYQQFISA